MIEFWNKEMITKPTSDTYCYVGRNLAFLFYDDMDSTRNAVFDVWTLDLSGTEQGAGGVGGLAWVKYNDTLYIPHYDANGNVMDYYDGTTKLPVASYTYDAFGRTIAQSGPMATFFHHRFSTKYYDEETGLYYYGYRFYSPGIGRWLNRDPIEENGGINLYSYCNNNINFIDILGLKTWVLIYYGKEQTPQFRYAAETERKRIMKANSFQKKCDRIIMKEVVTADDFLRAWDDINIETRMDDNGVIQEMHIYSHGGVVRLFFLDSEITPKQIKKLEHLNWAKDAELFLHGCYTGVSDRRGESTATCFSESQEVKSVGQPKSSDFSTSKTHRSIFTVANWFSRELYLLSYGDIDGSDFGPVLSATSLFVPTNSLPTPKCKKTVPPKKYL